MSVTLAQLKTRARQRSDMENSTFVSDSELTSYINSSLAELYDLLVAAYGDEYFLANPYPISVVTGTADYTLPTDFYKLKGVDASVNGSQWLNVLPFNFNERNRGQNGAPETLRYRIMGSNIKFNPAVSASVQIWYVPVAPTLVSDADTFNDVNKYSEYIVVDAAIKMLQKEESDVSVLMAQKQALKRRLEEMAGNRDAGSPESVTDIYAQYDDFWYNR